MAMGEVPHQNMKISTNNTKEQQEAGLGGYMGTNSMTKNMTN
jgi:hypothetical protein